MIINLLLINIIIVLIFISGFVDEVDDSINRKWRFHHLPKPFSCALCMTWWTSLAYILFSGQLSLVSIALCLANAHLTEITTPMVTVLKNWLIRIVEWMMPR